MRTNAVIWAAILLLLASAACSRTDTGGAPEKRPGYDFIENFAAGSIAPAEEPSTPTGKPALVLSDFAVGGEKRPAIITLAQAKIVFQIREVSRESRLLFGVGMNTTLGDGAEGIITVEADGASETIFTKALDPVTRVEDRKWFDESLDMSKYAGKNITIIFETRPGAKGDATGDWVAWSNPLLSK
jgi:hypothetical protein